MSRPIHLILCDHRITRRRAARVPRCASTTALKATVGAILGALAGVTIGKQGIPKDWLASIWEWPRSLSLIERVAMRLAEQKGMQQSLGPVSYFWPGLIPRN